MTDLNNAEGVLKEKSNQSAEQSAKKRDSAKELYNKNCLLYNKKAIIEGCPSG